jgi:hypothetical protein
METKVKVIAQYQQLAGVLDKGDEVTIVPILSSEPKLVHHAWVTRDWKTGKVLHTYCPELIAPAGSYEGYTFKSKNGNTYSDKTILNAIGYVSIKKIFAKV